jgi:solute:Na+ symporter, SSS family
VLAKVRAADPSFHENRNMGRDALNVGVAIIAQMTLVTIPLYMVLRDMRGLWLSALVLLVTGWILKKNWYEKLDA